LRICIIADASGPVNASYPGHGLGQATLHIAQGLWRRGHDVTLIAAEGSAFEGNLIIAVKSGVDYSHEKYLAKAAIEAHKEKPFDVFLDNSHLHHLSDIFPDLPVVNVYHDIFQPEQRCPVLMSDAQRAMMRYAWSRHAKVIHNTVNADVYTFNSEPDEPPYALFMGIIRDYKNPILAMEACARAGVHLKLAGALHGYAPLFNPKEGGNTEYVGTVQGEKKVKLIQGASVFLQLGTVESFGLTTIEAGLCGVPVVALPRGGNVELVKQGVNGAFAPAASNAVQAVADTIEYAMTLDRRACRDYAVQFSYTERQVSQYEAVLMKAAGGEVW
jgi:glycosyltransferase involved in cell wall biosynthesis